MRALRSDSRLFGQLVRHADAIEAGRNLLARDANQQSLAVDRAALEVVSRLSMRAGGMGDAMAEAARRVTGGAKPADAARDLLQRVLHGVAAAPLAHRLAVQPVLLGELLDRSLRSLYRRSDSVRGRGAAV